MAEDSADGFDRDWPLIARVFGWLSRDQAAALHAAASRVRPGHAIVEIGSHKGRSTIALGKGKAAGVGLLAVDPWGGANGDEVLAAFRRNLEESDLATEVQVFRGTSEQASREEARLRELLTGASPDGGWIGLLFVDGLHDRNSVLADIHRWEPSVVMGGLVYFHDAFFRRGVTLAVLERHLLNPRFRYRGSGWEPRNVPAGDIAATARCSRARWGSPGV